MESSLDIFRLGSFFGIFVWQIPFGICHASSFACCFSLGIFRLKSLAWDLFVLWELALGLFVWVQSFGIFRVDFVAWVFVA